MHSTVQIQHIPHRQNTAAADTTVRQELSRKEGAGCFAHGAAAHLLIKVWHCCSLRRPRPGFHPSRAPTSILLSCPCVSPCCRTPRSTSMKLPHPSLWIRPVQCQELTAKQRPPGNTLPSVLLAMHQSFMLYVYIPLGNAPQTSLGVPRTDLPWEMPQPRGRAALAGE